ncbi:MULTISPECIES: hypothetical protein [Mammaliicoccus]|uniref:hypothetical protein n=1 Tax=Mammaliicoccus TaxID=2803850 RepID=UPI001C4F62F1|nr:MULTISPECIES: hypothetical protein [Mammaliicoccus]MBW0766212.1 hypothetical protein [Mammaliicoccus lentus]WHI54760.1 hypothetical protein PYH59_13235 [Mammaliicoccus lentus]WHI57283.1 hypothetical protein PYH49_12910 [Mammaliicoccus lentus]WHI65128.1 hypothetical protein PYH50_12910 [Mammaliicoccus lentus]WHI86022.1 hypothetical protein PYH60_12920 [Mammaliicoccus lentus]
MLTKEFSAKVGLSEKQVRKIVQHLEDRGYQLSKTEYRGREATDFQEEDIELFQEIAEKVKETNSYDQAFETLEKEKDFLQVLVKDEPTQQTPELQQLIDELRTEVQHMRRERQMLGEMLQQVHITQQKLEQTLALQAPQETQNSEPTENTNVAEKETIQTETSPKEEVEATTTQSVKTEDIDETPSKVTVAAEEASKENNEQDDDNKQASAETKSDQSEEVKAETAETTETAKESSEKEEVKEEAKDDKEESTTSETSNDETVVPLTAESNQSEESPKEEPKKKGFFQRLFNI